MSDIKISFVIPAYNVGDYLARCLQSVLDQGLSDIEVLVVDDGSTDHTPTVCESFAAAHPAAEIVLLRGENAGVSAARNRGMAAARGKYICFLDGDDFYIAPFAARFYSLCEEHTLDIIRGIYSIYDEESGECRHINRCALSYTDIVLSGRDFLAASIREKANEVVPWLGFFRREFLLSHALAFPEGIAFEEDQLFFLQALLEPSARVMQTADDFYAYMVRAGSASKSPSLSRAYDALTIAERELALIRKTALSRAHRRAALAYVGSSFYQLTSIYGRVSPEDQKTLRRAMRGHRRLGYCLYAGTAHQRRKNFLFQYFPRFVAWVYRKRRKSV